MSDCKHCHGPHEVERHAERKRQHEAGRKCSMCDQVEHETHLATAKKQAIAYLPHHPNDAIVAMVAMLSKHSDWQDPIARALCADALGKTHTVLSARQWIEGWK